MLIWLEGFLEACSFHRVVILCHRLKKAVEWEICVAAADCSWKQIAEHVMELYTETTDGSTMEDKETALVWSYEDADPDFGSCQAKELLDHLESVLPMNL